MRKYLRHRALGLLRVVVAVAATATAFGGLASSESGRD